MSVNAGNKLFSFLNIGSHSFFNMHYFKKFGKFLYVFGLFITLGCKKNDNSVSTVPPNDSVPGKPVPSSFAKGADISWLTQMEASAYSFL